MKLNQPPIRVPFDDEMGVTGPWADWCKQVYEILKTVPQSGTTAKRPTKLFIGQMYFDTTIGKPIWVNGAGTGWVKADGTAA